VGAHTLFDPSTDYLVAIVLLCLLQAVTIAVLLRSRTRLRRSEQALRASNARNTAMLRTMPDMMFLQSREGEYLDFFAKDRTKLVMAPERFLGKRMSEILAPELNAQLQRCFDETAETGEPARAEYALPLTDGWHDFEARVVTCNGGFLSIVREITDRKRAEEALHRAQADVERLTRLTGMGELAASIAHDVDQPLCAIIANAQAGLRSHPARSTTDQELVRGALADIVKDARRASNVVHKTRRLFVERTEAKAKVNANELVESVVGLARRSLDGAGVSVRTVLAPNVPDMLGDAVLLRQVLLNLAMNAIDAMKGSMRRHLTIASTAEPGGLVAVRVTDTGRGLHPEEAQEVFRAFHTVRPEGMGTGLAISRAIVAAHGGRLWATPNPEGGATFQFVIPVAPQAYGREPVARCG
jgi:PAS domain S-box-containing protein